MDAFRTTRNGQTSICPASMSRMGLRRICVLTALIIALLYSIVSISTVRHSNETHRRSHPYDKQLLEIEDAHHGNAKKKLQLVDYNTLLPTIMAKHQLSEQTCTWYNDPTIQAQSTCTFATIQSYMDTCGFFPTQLTLDQNKNPHFKFCQLPNIPRNDLLNYFHEKIDRIVTFGDSQGRLYSGGILGRFHILGIKCTALKREPEGWQSKKSYFFNDSYTLEALVDVNRTCRTCNSFLQECLIPATPEHQTPRVLYFEFIGIIMNRLSGFMINREYCEDNPTAYECQFKTLAHVIFKYYLNGSSRDLMFMYPTFAHDVRVPFVKIVPKLEELFELMHDVLPESSHVIWVPSTTANYHEYPFDNKDNGTTLSLREEMLNHWMFELLQKYTHANNGPRFHGFFDVGEIGRIQEKEWASDYIHLKHEFYEMVMTMVFNLLPTI